MKKKTILSSLVFILIILLFAVQVYATDTGTINFIAVNNSDSTAIEGLEIAIYQVSYTESNNFNWSTGFEDCTIDLDSLTEETISELKTYAEENAEPIFTYTTDENGEFSIANLELGNYLLVQANKTDEYTMQTILVTIPELTSENGLQYEITAKPKIVSNSTISESSTELVTDSEIPYTGVLNWPIPILVAVGLVVFCIAWLKVFSNSKKKSKLAIFFMIFGLAIFACGAGLYIYNNMESNKIAEDNLETVTEIETIMEEETDEEEISAITVDGNRYIGIIYIPILDNLALPVLEECTDSNLKISICKYAGSPDEGNLVIGGHRYKSTFAKLADLEEGNIVYYKEASGDVYKYKLKEVEILDPSDVYELQTGDWDLTLFTCTYDNRQREAYRFEYDY